MGLAGLESRLGRLAMDIDVSNKHLCSKFREVEKVVDSLSGMCDTLSDRANKVESRFFESLQKSDTIANQLQQRTELNSTAVKSIDKKLTRFEQMVHACSARDVPDLTILVKNSEQKVAELRREMDKKQLSPKQLHEAMQAARKEAKTAAEKETLGLAGKLKNLDERYRAWFEDFEARIEDWSKSSEISGLLDQLRAAVDRLGSIEGSLPVGAPNEGMGREDDK